MAIAMWIRLFVKSGSEVPILHFRNFDAVLVALLGALSAVVHLCQKFTTFMIKASFNPYIAMWRV